MAATYDEVACFATASITDSRQVHVEPVREAVVHFDPAERGGGCVIGSQAPRVGLAQTWTLNSSAPKHLHLCEVDLTGQRPVRRGRIVFDAILFPEVVAQQQRLIAITDDGFLHSIQLPGHQSHESLTQGLSIASMDLHAELRRLGAPACLAVTHGSTQFPEAVLIGGQSGSLLVVPIKCFSTQSAMGSFELQETANRYLSFFGKSTVPAVVWVSTLQPISPDLVCVLHEDFSMRFWNIKTRLRVATAQLLQQSGHKANLIPGRIGAVCGAQGHFRLVVHLQPNEDSDEQPQTAAVSMDIQPASDGSLQIVNMKERMLEVSNADFSCILSQQDTADPYSAHTWLLSPAPSLHAIASSVSAPSDATYHTTLIEKQGVAVQAGEHHLQDAVWSTFVTAIQSMGQDVPADLMVRHHMQHLLAPGALSQAALAAALEELQQPLASGNTSLHDVQLHLTAAAQAVKAQQKLSELASWRHVSQTYWKHWAEHHPALGLLPLPGGGVAVVRAGHALTLLRKTNSTQEIQQQSATDATMAATGDLQKLQQCMDLLQELLGPDVLSLFATLTMTTHSSQLSLQSVCKAFVEVLTSGPKLNSGEQPLNHSARQALLAWRRKRSAAILQLGQIISSMISGTPIAALRAYLDALQAQYTHSQTARGVSTPPSCTPGEPLTITVRQIATQQLQASKHLLLIAWLHSLGSAGVLTISPTVSNVLHQEIVPQLQIHSCRVAISQWLCTAPAAVSRDQEGDSAQPPQLHKQLASLAFASGTAAQDNSRQQCVAQLLLPDFACLLNGASMVQQPAEAAAALAAHLHAGCRQVTGLTPLTDSALVQQVLALGLQLIQHSQWSHVQHLLSLAGPVAQTAGGQFLKGFASLHQVSSVASEQKHLLVQEAVGKLFQAAGVFKAARQPTHYGQQAHVAGSCDMIKRVIQNLLTTLTGSYSIPAEGEEELQYFEALMMQCEQWGQPQAAAHFAQAALHEVQKVYANQNTPLAEQDQARWTAQRHRREDRLCANLFVYALDAGRFALQLLQFSGLVQDAYNAVQANPTAEGALNSLTRLVKTLVSTSNIATLCQLPFAAYYTVAKPDGRCEIVSLAEVTHQLLEQQAANSDLGCRPQPYDILYDFHIMRSNYKAAAAAQYSLATRIREEGMHLHGALNQIAAALLAAVNALSMVEQSQQWLLQPQPLHAALQPPQTFLASSQEALDKATCSTGAANGASRALQSRCKAGVTASVIVLSGHAVPEGYSQYTDLTKEHAAAQAHVTLAAVEPEADHRPMAPDDIFHRLLAAGLFQAALSLAVVLHKGLPLTQALEAAVAAMASACVQKQLDTAQHQLPSLPVNLAFGHTPAWQGVDPNGRQWADFEGLSADAAWTVVLHAIKQHDRREHGCRLHLAAVQAALGKERRLKLPSPLLAPFQATAAQQQPTGLAGRAADPAALLRLYLRYDRLSDAADLALSHFAAYQKADVTSRQGHCQVWFPYQTIRQLIAGMDKSPALYHKCQRLQQALESHQNAAMELSAAFQAKFSDAVITEE